MNFPSKAGSSCCIAKDCTRSKSIPHPFLQILGTSVLWGLRILSLMVSQDFYQSLIYLPLIPALHLWQVQMTFSISFKPAFFFLSCILVNYNDVVKNHNILREKKAKSKDQQTFVFLLLLLAFFFIPKISPGKKNLCFLICL